MPSLLFKAKQKIAVFFGSSFYSHLILIVVLSLFLRLYKINSPLADWHSFRQADTASVTREYVKHGIDLLLPRYHDISNVQAGLLTGGVDNLEGYRMVEFPIVNGFIALLLHAIPGADLVITSRLVSITASLLALIAIALLGKELFSARAGLLAGAVLGFLPFSVFYSRVILPEPFLVSFISCALLFFYFYQTQRKFLFLLVSMSCLALALLIKPMAIFVAPAFLGIVLVKRGVRGIADPKLIGIGILSLVPVLLWRDWITQFPTGIPWSSWLYNFDGIRLRPAWWRWLFWERLTKLWLGGSGVLFFILGLIPKKITKKFSPEFVLYTWGIGMFSYLVVFATGNVRHDYYQVLLLPFVALVMGRGMDWMLLQKPKIFSRMATVILSVFALYFSWQEVKGYYTVNHWEIIEAGKAANLLLPQEAKVITPYNGDTAFLFQTNRTGWPVGFEIDKKIANGATHYVSVNFDDEANALMQKYTVLQRTEKYVILDLTKPL